MTICSIYFFFYIYIYSIIIIIIIIIKNRVKVNILTYFNIKYYKSISYKMLS